MNIPKQLKVGGIVYDIDRHTSGDLGVGVDGEACFYNCKIKLVDQSPQWGGR